MKEFKQDMTTFKNDIVTRVDKIEYQNKHEHQQLAQMIKELDKEVIQLKPKPILWLIVYLLLFILGSLFDCFYISAFGIFNNFFMLFA